MEYLIFILIIAFFAVLDHFFESLGCITPRIFIKSRINRIFSD